MEHLWSLAGATGGNRSQMGEPRKWLKQTDWQPVATHGNRFAAHGKEGVNGSSPSEGSAKMPHVGAFAYVFSRSEALWGTDGAVYGAFASTTPFRPALKRESPRVTPACLV
jgi:hypothetical protein